MGNATVSGGLEKVLWMPRFGPALFGAFLLGLMLLFINELPQNCRTYMVPSLAMYALGAAFLGTIHRLLGFHYVSDKYPNNEKPIPVIWRIVVYLIHLLWFGALVAYNFWRCAL